MFISFFRFVFGYVKLLIKGYSPERFLNLCRNKNMNIWGLEATKDGYVCCMKISDFRKLKPIIRKSQTKVSIVERYGIPFFFHKYRKRKIFFIGFFISIMLIYSMTFFVWNIEIEGNQKITDEVFLEYLQSIHIRHGMNTSDVECEEIAKKIRNHFEDVIWVSVSMNGTKLTIHVREKDKTFLEKEQEEACDIVSEKDGIVTSIITRKGTPQVNVGDEIMVGDILVSGTVPVLNDAKEVVSNHYVAADADVIIERQITYEKSIDKVYTLKRYTNKKRNIRYIKIGNRIISLGFSKTNYKNAEHTTQEKQVKLGSNFYLPIYFGKKEIVEYKIESKEYSREEMENLLIEDFLYYCNNLESENVQILDSKYQIIFTETGAKLSALIKSREEVGIVRKIIDLSVMPMVE